jgi:membrane-bound ClpP family serine protease
MSDSSSKAHLLDLKVPLGGLMTLYGLVLAIYGLLTGSETYAKSLGVNINLIWGILMLVLGGGFLLFHFVRDRS